MTEAFVYEAIRTPRGKNKNRALNEVKPIDLVTGLIDEVRMDVAPVVFGSGKRYFGPVQRQHLLEDPDIVIQGNQVLHLRFRVRR